jgi:glutathione synthase
MTCSHLLAIGAYGRTDINEDNLPNNPAVEHLAAGFARAHEKYGKSDALILFVVQDPEVHAFDQRWLEYYLLEKHRIQIVRMTLREVHLTARLDDDRRLMVPTLTSDLHTHEISVVYFRAGYGPSDYPSDKEWQARRLLELSRAIKCPTIITQLAGCKKVQQMLATPGALER